MRRSSASSCQQHARFRTRENKYKTHLNLNRNINGDKKKKQQQTTVVQFKMCKITMQYCFLVSTAKDRRKKLGDRLLTSARKEAKMEDRSDLEEVRSI